MLYFTVRVEIVCFGNALLCLSPPHKVGREVGKSGIVEQRTVIIKWVRKKQVVWHAMLPCWRVGGEISATCAFLSAKTSARF